MNRAKTKVWCTANAYTSEITPSFDSGNYWYRKKVRLEFGQINKSVSSDFEEESRAVLSVKKICGIFIILVSGNTSNGQDDIWKLAQIYDIDK